MKILLFIAIFFIITNNAISQNSKGDMALYNIALGSLVSGVGAAINKKPNEKLSKVFLKGMYQGALGGYLVYESKNLIGKISEKQKLEYSWGAKMVNSAGISIIENATLNKDFWERWHVNLGFNRFEFHTKNKFKFRYRIMPVSFLLTSYVAVNNKFEFKKTLQTGEPIFSNETVRIIDEGSAANYGNAIILTNAVLNDYNTMSHEIIHTYQYYDFNFVNSFLNKPLYKKENTSKFLKKFNSIFYLDAQLAVFGSIYLLEYNNSKSYYDNFFENEAGFYSNTVSE